MSLPGSTPLQEYHSSALSPWRSPCGSTSRPQSRFRQTPLAGNPLVSGYYLGAPLSGCRPVGNSLAPMAIPLSKDRLIGGLSLYQHPLRNIDPGDRGAFGSATLAGIGITSDLPS